MIPQNLSLEQLEWTWFKGNEVSARLLQSVGMFRSYVLYDLGQRKNFGPLEHDFGDIRYVDFESYHIVASYEGMLVGAIRVVPPMIETVTLSILGMEDYKTVIEKMGGSLTKVIETSRIVVDHRFRQLSLGRTLVYAAIALIELLWNREEMFIICSGGNCAGQAEFLQGKTDYCRIPGELNRFSATYNDEITLLVYKQRPYTKGVEWIESFKEKFSHQRIPEYPKFGSFYEISSQQVQ